MAKPKKVEGEEETVVVPEAGVEATPSKKAPKKDVTRAEVYSATGGLVRVYDLETHGPEFEELAKEFISHEEGTSIELH